MADTNHCDLALVGGGLAGGLIALALTARHPSLDVRIIESGGSIGGNHIWSFFDADVAGEDRWLVEPLICHSWDRYDIAFPALKRTLNERYNSILSERLDAVVRAALPADRLLTGVAAKTVGRSGVTLADGRHIAARAVIDVRGPADLSRLDLGWQKFVGQVVRLEVPHGLDRPTVMDATVPQIDGYRFVYVLPLDDHRLLIEDTYYSDGPALDVPGLAGRIGDYAAMRGWPIAEIERQESGVLPVALGGDFEGYWRSGGEAAKAGVRAGLFHPTTGYSLPDAIRTARLVAGLDDPAGPGLHDMLHGHARRTWRARGFYRLLDRMLFRAAVPADRYRVLQRFYGLDAGLVGRFYAGRSTAFDKLRILSGKPPVPLIRALRVLKES